MKKRILSLILAFVMACAAIPSLTQSARAADTTPPTLTEGTAKRIAQLMAAVSFTSDEAGTFYWQLDGEAPAVQALVNNAMSPRGDLIAGTNTRNFAGLSTDAHTLYIAAEDAAGNVSDLLVINIPAYSSGDTVYHTVTFDSNGGSEVNSATVANNSKAAKPADPAKGGFVFGGWYSDSALTTPHDFEKAITENATLYAKWALPFTDVAEGAWYYNAVYYVYETGLMVGTADDKFSPDASLTRAMIVTILYRNAGAPDVGGLENRFDDADDGQWYTNAVKWASENEIVLGYGDGKFGTNDPVTKEQLAVLIYRMQHASGKIPPDILTDKEWPDGDKIGDWAASAVNALTGQGIFLDIPCADFNPQTPATRAEVASILFRYLGNL